MTCPDGCCPAEVIDLCCKAGGASKGLQLAWPHAHISGVDLEPQPRYPFAFRRMDALGVDLRQYDFIWASPPCQAHTTLQALTKRYYVTIIEALRERLIFHGIPWVIENVPGAPIRRDVLLCGTMFGLRSYRHRHFELGSCWVPALRSKLLQPPHPPHLAKAPTKGRRAAWDAGSFASITGDTGTYMGPEAMGIDWMTGDELSQAVPPAYSQFVASQLTPALIGESVA